MRAQFTNLYVKNLDTEVTHEKLAEHFAKMGKITSLIVAENEEGRSKGFGFVNYESHEEAQRAIDELHDTEFYGKKLFVTRAQKKAEREEELRQSYEQAKLEKLSKYQGVNLYIKNLEDDFDDEKLRVEFEPFGTITSCKVMRDEKGISKGFGFVCFSSPDEATKAVAEMNNKMIGSKPLYVSLAQRREVRRQQLESQIAQRNQIRMQQAAAAGIPGGYLNSPVYYPPGPGYPANRIMSYSQSNMMPRRYPPNGSIAAMSSPMAGLYPQGTLQPYGMSGYSRGAPRAPIARGPGSSPTLPNAPIPRANGPPNVVAPRPGPQGAPIPGRTASTEVPVPASRAPQPSHRKPHVRPQGAPADEPTVPAAVVPVSSEQTPIITAEQLAAIPSAEQKQVLGELIYMKIFP